MNANKIFGFASLAFFGLAALADLVAPVFILAGLVCLASWLVLECA